MEMVLEQWLAQYWPWILVAVALVVVLWAIIKIIKYLQRLWQQWTQPFKKGQTYRCKVVRVTDGDTVTCQKRFFSRKQTTLRLAYIDAPESKQSYGPEATQALQRLVLNKNIQVLITDVDGYGRHVADLFRNGQNINERMIRQGHAWAYPTYGKNKAHKERLLLLQSRAKSDKLGLWKSHRVQNPSDFRKSR